MSEHGGKPPYPLYAKELCLPVRLSGSDDSQSGRGKGRSWPWGIAPYLFYAQKLCLSVKLSAKSRDGSQPRGKGAPRFSERRLLFGRPRKAKMSDISAASVLHRLLILSFPGIGHCRPWVRGADCSARSTKYEYDSIPAPKCNSVFAKYFLKRAKEGYFGTATAPLPAKNARESAPSSGRRGLLGAAPAAGGEWLDPARADRPAGGAYRDAEGG